MNPTLTMQAIATRTSEKIMQRSFDGRPRVKKGSPVSSIDPAVTHAVVRGGAAGCASERYRVASQRFHIRVQAGECHGANILGQWKRMVARVNNVEARKTQGLTRRVHRASGGRRGGTFDFET